MKMEQKDNKHMKVIFERKIAKKLGRNQRHANENTR